MANDDSRFLEKPGHLIRRLQQISLALFMDQAEAFGITPVQYSAIIAINNHPGIDQTALCNIIAFDRSTIGDVVGRLEKKKLIKRLNGAGRPAHQIALHHAVRPPLDRAHRAGGAVHAAADSGAAKARRARAFMQMLKHLVHLNNEHSRAPLRPKDARQRRRGPRKIAGAGCARHAARSSKDALRRLRPYRANATRSLAIERPQRERTDDGDGEKRALQAGHGESGGAGRGADQKAERDRQHGQKLAADFGEFAHGPRASCRLSAQAAARRRSVRSAAMPSCVILPVMTLVCGMPFIRSRTSTLCAPIAMAANRPATMPCQSLASLIGGPNTHHRGEDREQRRFERQHPRQRGAAGLSRAQAIRAAVNAAATTKSDNHQEACR